MLGYHIYDNEAYLYNKIKEVSKRNLIFVLIVANIAQILEAYIFNGRNYYFSTILVSIIIFLIIIKDKEILKNTLINKIGKQSLGIYLIHVMILDSLYLFVVKLNLQYLTFILAWQIIITTSYFYNILDIIYSN